MGRADSVAITTAQDTSIDVVDVMTDAIATIETPDDARIFTEKLIDLEKILKAAKTFELNAKRYTALENAAYIRIVELGYEGSVPNSVKPALRWYANLPNDERNLVIEDCNGLGVSIRSYYRLVVVKERKQKEAIGSIRYETGIAINEFRKKGYVELGEYFRSDLWRNVPDDVRLGLYDTARRRVRQLGGHGLGDGKGTYVTAENGVDYFKKIIANKQDGIRTDVKRANEFFMQVSADVGWGKDSPIRQGDKIEVPIEHCCGDYSPTIDSAWKMPAVILGIGMPVYKMPDSSIPIFLARLCRRFGWTVNEIHDAIVSRWLDEHQGRTALQELGYKLDNSYMPPKNLKLTTDAYESPKEVD